LFKGNGEDGGSLDAAKILIIKKIMKKITKKTKMTEKNLKMGVKKIKKIKS
jgi:hypothetical protein